DESRRALPDPEGRDDHRRRPRDLERPSLRGPGRHARGLRVLAPAAPARRLRGIASGHPGRVRMRRPSPNRAAIALVLAIVWFAAAGARAQAPTPAPADHLQGTIPRG